MGPPSVAPWGLSSGREEGAKDVIPKTNNRVASRGLDVTAFSTHGARDSAPTEKKLLVNA